MNTRQLYYAVELSKSLNFSVTANKLGISQPALSKQILHLENELGLKLFDRSSTPLSLTPAGEHFISNVQNMLYHEEQLLKSMEEFKSGERGTITIGISPFRASYLIPKIVKRIKAQFPNVKVVLHEDTSDQLRKDAIDGKYDFAIVNLPIDEQQLDFVALEPDKMVLVVPNCYLNLISHTADSKMQKIDFNQCQNLPFVVLSSAQEMRTFFEKLCRDANITPSIAAEVNSLNSALALAKEGVGAALLPLQFIEELENDSIKLFAIKNVNKVRQPVIITKKGQYLSKQAKFAIELLTKK